MGRLRERIQNTGRKSKMSAPAIGIDVYGWDVSTDEAADGQFVASVSKGSSVFRFQGCRVRGVACPPWLNVPRWEKINDAVKLRSSDIIVATFPKSGTTLTEQAVLLFLSGAQDSALQAKDKNAIGRRRGSDAIFCKVWPEACLMLEGDDNGEATRGAEFSPLDMADFDALPPPRIIKTHAPVELLIGCSKLADEGEGPSYVVVSRSPKDTVTSAYYHAFNPAKSGWPFEAWVAAWLAGITPFGSWTAWVRGWRERVTELGPRRALFLTFEELTSPDETLRLEAFRRLGEFVTRRVSIDDKGDDAEFEALVRRVDTLCQFDVMKSQAQGAAHMRQGKPGNWREHFTPDLQATFDGVCGEDLLAIPPGTA